MKRALYTLALVASGALAAPASALADGEEPSTAASDNAPEEMAGGTHWRVVTARGPVHVWVPADYDPATAGVVLYVHGYRTTVDQAFAEHRLAEQFAASGRNALFIAPRAPSSKRQSVRFGDIGELVREVRERTGVERPWGPVVAVGHSGAYRTLTAWLDDPDLEHIVLLDGLYGNDERFRDWLAAKRARPRRLTLVSMDTIVAGEAWVREQPDAVVADWVPERVGDLDAKARGARFLYLRSQYGHMEIVTEGKAIPVLLQATRLGARGE